MDEVSHELGHIQLIIGPMFSGKTTEMLRRIRRYTIAKRRCLVVKYEGDTRYSKDLASTHDRATHKAISCSELAQVRDAIADVDVIGIDEGQFYPDVVEFCEHAANAGKIVVVSALDGTFQRKPFGDILHLVPLAESVTKLNAVCMLCHSTASFSARISGETDVKLIGGSDHYISVCRRCFHDPQSAFQAAALAPKAASPPASAASEGKSSEGGAASSPASVSLSSSLVSSSSASSGEASPSARKSGPAAAAGSLAPRCIDFDGAASD